MIGLERLTDGSVTARNFDALQRLVPDTGGISIRVRAGKVDSAGAVELGTGFSSVRTGAGAYTVTVGFDSEPVVIATPGDTAGALACKVSAASATSFSVSIYTTTTGAQTDAAFNWWAIG